MIARILAAGLALAMLAALPARAQTIALFDDDIRFGTGPLSCTAAYMVMFEHAKTHDYGESYSSEAYRTRALAVAPGVTGDGASVEEASAQIKGLADQYWNYMNWARLTHAALDFDSFFRFLGRCDAAHGHTPGSEALSLQVRAGRADLRGNLPRDNDSIVLRELTEQSFFDFRLFENRAACAASYRAMADILDAAKSDAQTDNPLRRARLENRRTFVTVRPDHRLGEIDFAARAEAAAAGADPARVQDRAEAMESFLTLFFYPATGFDGAWVRDEFDALADVLTRCDRKLDLRPRTRNMLSEALNPGLDAQADCLALLDIARDQFVRDGTDPPPVIAQYRDAVFARSGANENMDLRDLLIDRAIQEQPYWEFEASEQEAADRVKECFP